MVQQSKKGSGCATPKENINRISAVDEEHFLVSCWQYSLIGTQTLWCPLLTFFLIISYSLQKENLAPWPTKGTFFLQTFFHPLGGPGNWAIWPPTSTYVGAFVVMASGLCASPL